MSGSNKKRGSVPKFVVARRMSLMFTGVWGFFISLENLSGILTYLGWHEAGLIAHCGPPTVISVILLIAAGWILRVMLPARGVFVTSLAVLGILLLVLICWYVPTVARLLCAFALGRLLMHLLFGCPIQWLRTALLSVFGSLVAAGVVFSGLHQKLIVNVPDVQLLVRFVGMWWVVYTCYLVINHGTKFSRLSPGEGFKALTRNKVGALSTLLVGLGLLFSIPQAMWGFEFIQVKATLDGSLYCYSMNPRIISPGAMQVILAYVGLGCCIGNLLSSHRVPPKRLKNVNSAPTS